MMTLLISIEAKLNGKMLFTWMIFTSIGQSHICRFFWIDFLVTIPCYSHLCFVHPSFRFWFLVTFGNKDTKIQKYYIIFIYVLQDKQITNEKKSVKISKKWWVFETFWKLLGFGPNISEPNYQTFIPVFVFGFWSLLATKIRKYKNIT